MAALPSVELHAHLNGSVRPSTVLELAAEQQLDSPDLAAFTLADASHRRTLEECFSVFSVIHRVTSRPEAIRRIVAEAMHDYAQEGCCLLELRTTPKDLPPSLSKEVCPAPRAPRAVHFGALGVRSPAGLEDAFLFVFLIRPCIKFLRATLVSSWTPSLLSLQSLG